MAPSNLLSPLCFLLFCKKSQHSGRLLGISRNVSVSGGYAAPFSRSFFSVSGGYAAPFSRSFVSVSGVNAFSRSSAPRHMVVRNFNAEVLARTLIQCNSAPRHMVVRNFNAKGKSLRDEMAAKITLINKNCNPTCSVTYTEQGLRLEIVLEDQDVKDLTVVHNMEDERDEVIVEYKKIKKVKKIFYVPAKIYDVRKMTAQMHANGLLTMFAPLYEKGEKHAVTKVKVEWVP